MRRRKGKVCWIMKNTCAILVAAIASILAGCSTPPAVVRAPVGPDPFATAIAAHNGFLQVFSATEEKNDVGFEFPYYQRTDYYIDDSNGKPIECVRDNNRGHFDDTPDMIPLPPGTYKVKALMAQGFGRWIVLPVKIEPGRTTEIHLNRHWRPPAATPRNAVVRVPGWGPVGWRAVPLAGRQSL